MWLGDLRLVLCIERVGWKRIFHDVLCPMIVIYAIAMANIFLYLFHLEQLLKLFLTFSPFAFCLCLYLLLEFREGWLLVYFQLQLPSSFSVVISCSIGAYLLWHVEVVEL